jgi:hypothetical protein
VFCTFHPTIAFCPVGLFATYKAGDLLLPSFRSLQGGCRLFRTFHLLTCFAQNQLVLIDWVCHVTVSRPCFVLFVVMMHSLRRIPCEVSVAKWSDVVSEMPQVLWLDVQSCLHPYPICDRRTSATALKKSHKPQVPFLLPKCESNTVVDHASTSSWPICQARMDFLLSCGTSLFSSSLIAGQTKVLLQSSSIH